ncbi:ovochymase-1-like [Pomacea canaliculata]|uniref:ovochymase-1-like n=1 Tax=Pomacea canaliculata TaxID=400727 RepID=UPI000D72578A|nr:ovochymase-1-like [Pomacea canaliculata]
MNPLPALLLSLVVVAVVADDSLTEVKIDGPGCGHRNPPYTEPMISTYIVNGEPAPPYVYPYICLLYHGNMQVCGGALITNSTGHYWFLTAGHCLETGLDAVYTIRCGIYNTRGPSQPFEFNPQHLRPFVHEDYDTKTKHNDIALFPLRQTGFPQGDSGGPLVAERHGELQLIEIQTVMLRCLLLLPCFLPLVNSLLFSCVGQVSVPCGSPQVLQRSHRIVGGEQSTLGTMPWMVVIADRGFYLCGGSIISSRLILTAAHCFDTEESQNPRNLQVYAAKLSLTKANKEEQLLTVQTLILHKDFNNITGANDIALLVLDKDLVFTSIVAPICLPSSGSGLLLAWRPSWRAGASPWVPALNTSSIRFSSPSSVTTRARSLTGRAASFCRKSPSAQATRRAEETRARGTVGHHSFEIPTINGLLLVSSVTATTAPSHASLVSTPTFLTT